MKLKIQKFNPLEDAEPYYVEGEVEYREGFTALDAIYLFHTNVEPVNFDFSCGGRICGRCACMIDGKPQMLCITVLDDKTHVIEPLEGHPIIRDLVVDKTAFDDSITAVANRIMLEPITKETLAPEGFQKNKEVQELMEFGELCSRCGMCMVNCPTKATHPDEYAGPAILLAIGYRHLDWYDQGNRVAQAVSEGMYHCIMCGTCSATCPMMIPHLSMWKLLRDAAEEEGLVPSYA
jgi:succinate dehydrogenase/fumarate reductase iron-sulfur protein